MDFTATRSALLRVLVPAARIAPRKSSMPILGCALIEATADGIEVMATDTFQSVRALADAKVSKPGAICVPAAYLLDVVKSLADGNVRIRVTETCVEVSAGKPRFQVPMVPSLDFPVIARAPGDMESVDASSLLATISPAIPTLGTDDTRAYIACMRLEIGPKRMRATTTDGNRICTSEAAHESKVALDAHVPHRGVGELRALLDSVTGAKVRIGTHERRLFVIAAGVELGLLLGGEGWPDLDQATATLLRDMKRSTMVATTPMAACVRRAKLAADKIGTVWLRFGAGTLVVRGASSEAGAAVDELPIAYDVTEEYDHGISAQYALDALAAVGGDELRLLWGGPLDPLAFERVEDGASVRVFCMARRLVPAKEAA